MIIPPACFPTPDLIKRTNNRALWDVQDRFATSQAAAANESLTWLGERLDAAATPLERSAAFVQLYRDLAEWRFRLAKQMQGSAPDSLVEQFRTPIAPAHPMADIFGENVHTEGGGLLDPETRTLTRGEPTPASRTAARIGAIIQARFDADAPNHDVIQNRVTLPSGQVVNGNLLLRGRPAAEVYGLLEPVDGLYFTKTGDQQDRHSLQREAFGLLADLEGRRANGESDLSADPDAKHAFAQAEYFLYQGPEYQRGGDAMIRTLLVTAHARLFAEALLLPQDIDVMAYAAGQQAFHEHLRQNQSIVTARAARPVVAGAAAVRSRVRRAGVERD